MTAFSIEISDQKHARALFSFLKTLDSVKISKISSRKEDSSLSQKASLKFPFNIFYIIKTPVIFILAVWHKKRHPDGWKDRIE